MASVRQFSARLPPLRSAGILARTLPSSIPRRHESTDASNSKALTLTPSSSARHNQPNYSIEVDRATSAFTPVPKRIQTAGEDTDILPASVISGAPVELQGRTVRIYQESKPATQSGIWHGHHWRMDWDILPKGHRWENPLIGWQSSADFMQGTKLNFETRQDAIAFAERQGYEYFVQEPNSRRFTPKAYANNFLYSDKKLKIVRTK